MSIGKENDEVKVLVSDAEGPEEFVGFFEDDGEAGYLYISDLRLKNIIRHEMRQSFNKRL